MPVFAQIIKLGPCSPHQQPAGQNGKDREKPQRVSQKWKILLLNFTITAIIITSLFDLLLFPLCTFRFLVMMIDQPLIFQMWSSDWGCVILLQSDICGVFFGSFLWVVIRFGSPSKSVQRDRRANVNEWGDLVIFAVLGLTLTHNTHLAASSDALVWHWHTHSVTEVTMQWYIEQFNTNTSGVTIKIMQCHTFGCNTCTQE